MKGPERECAVFMDYSCGAMATHGTTPGKALTKKEAFDLAEKAILGGFDVGESRVTYVRVFKGAERIGAYVVGTKRKEAKS